MSTVDTLPKSLRCWGPPWTPVATRRPLHLILLVYTKKPEYTPSPAVTSPSVNIYQKNVQILKENTYIMENRKLMKEQRNKKKMIEVVLKNFPSFEEKNIFLKLF